MTDHVAPLPLQVAGAVRRFGGTVAVDQVDLVVHSGEVVTVVGPSGCGKSTLLRLIAGLVPLHEGEVLIAGEVVDDGRRSLPPDRRRVGLVFQDHALFPHLTVAANVAFGLGRVPASERRVRVAELLEMVGLAHLSGRYPHEVSGGERQRVSLARAVAPEPRLLLLDEPFANLDPSRRAQVRTDVLAMLRRTGTPAVLVTHDQAEALALGDRVAVLDRGALRQVGAPQEVFDRPADRFVAAYLGDASFLPAGPGQDLVVRPGDVRVFADAAGDAVVVTAEYRGERWACRVRMASGHEVLAEVPRDQPVAVGDAVTVEVVRPQRLAIVPSC